MQACHHPGKVHNHVVQWLARSDQCGQPPLVGHSAHHHHGLAVHTVDAAERCHAQVDIGGKPAIEFDLPTAGRLPLRCAPEVQESQVDRLLHLQGKITEENHHRRMGFAHGGIAGDRCHRQLRLPTTGRARKGEGNRWGSERTTAPAASCGFSVPLCAAYPIGPSDPFPALFLTARSPAATDLGVEPDDVKDTYTDGILAVTIGIGHEATPGHQIPVERS